jgi:hypothetical protein
LTVSPTAQTTPLVDSIKKTNKQKTTTKQQKTNKNKLTKTETVLAMQVKYR